MIAYGCLIILIILQSLFFLRGKNNKFSWLFYTLVWLELTLIAALRSVNVGRDTDNYFHTFRAVIAGRDLHYISKHMELGFLYFNKILSYISHSPQFLFFVIGAIYIYAFLRFIKKYSPWPLISIIIFISAVPFGSYIFGISFLRQALAISCLLLGIEQLLDGKKLLFIVWVFVGSIFHKSGIIGLVLLPLYNFPLNSKTLILALLGTIVFMVVFPVLVPHLPFGLSGYISYMAKESSDLSHFSAFLKATAQLYVTLMLVYVYISKQDISRTTRIFAWISLLAFICEFAAIRVLFMNRILYFTVCNCVLIPYALAHLYRKKVFLLFTLVFCLLFLFNNADFWMRRASREHVNQYEFYWNNPYGITRWNLYG